MAIKSEKDLMEHFDSLSANEQASLISDLQSRQRKDPSAKKPPGAPAGGITEAADLFEE